jgi:hypothetical protein
MIAYASRTGTRRNLDALRDADWRLMISARGVLRTEGFAFALDNGAWTASEKREPFQGDAFKSAVALLGRRADFIVIPDIVSGGLRSLAFSLDWLAWLRAKADLSRVLLLLAVQDGMEPQHVEDLISPAVGIFVGGSTDWKLRSMARWVQLAHLHKTWCHIGRVNTARRIALCAAAGADSFDGSSATRFRLTLPMLNQARNQPDLFAGEMR